MWNSFDTGARDGITAWVINYPGGNGDEIHAYRPEPAMDGGGKVFGFFGRYLQR